MHVDVVYTFRCTVPACDTTDVQTWPQQWLGHSRVLAVPVPPPGWVMLGPALVCPRHLVTVTVDGEAMLVDTDIPY